MSTKTQPTDRSKDCNELSTQNGRDTTPIAESGVVTSSSIEAPKKTSRTGRVLKPSAKQQAANDTSASRVSRITGNESLADKTARCDFSSNGSINEVFPCHKGKGTHAVTKLRLGLYVLGTNSLLQIVIMNMCLPFRVDAFLERRTPTPLAPFWMHASHD